MDSWKCNLFSTKLKVKVKIIERAKEKQATSQTHFSFELALKGGGGTQYLRLPMDPISVYHLQILLLFTEGKSDCKLLKDKDLMLCLPA